MAGVYDGINQLVNDIVENKINQKETKIRIDDLKKKYGDDIFPDFLFEPEKKPWNKSYLTKLKKMNITGACSEDFILHMAEVSDFVHKKERQRRFLFVLGGVVILIVILYLLLAGKK